MAIKTFKEILDNKGYRIDSNDRQIFENDSIESFFGLSANDVIEFIVYDPNDNQLPQQGYGLVRYIPLTIENIGDYFMIAEGTLFKKYQFPNEYFIDAERLLKEAGYTNGVFKTQITLLNKRVGNESNLNKLWISEISPSRSEIRLYPNSRGAEQSPELLERFNLMITDGNFREDVAKYSISFVEKIKPTEIASFLRSKYSDVWFEKLRAEYKIESFETFCTQIHNKFLEGCVYEFTNRISNINDINYGKPTATKQTISLKKSDVKIIIERILVNVLNKFMMIPDVKYGSKTLEKMTSLDESAAILQTKQSDLIIDTKSPEINKAVKKSVTQTTENLTLEKAILKEVPQELPTPPIVQPIGYQGGGGYSGGSYDYAGSYRNNGIETRERERQNLR
jgi:hypothetical protein